MVSFSGLSSGLDSRALIDAMVQAKRSPILRLQSQRDAVQVQLSRLGEVTSATNTLQSLLEGMKGIDDVLAVTAQSSDEGVMTVTAGADAALGAFEFDVSALARAEKNRSDAFGSPHAEVKAGTLSIAIDGGDAVDVSIEEGMTLKELASAINSADAGVSASVINDGNHSYLQMTADQSGHVVGGSASDAVVITESYTGANGSELALTEVASAQNSAFELDGLAIEQRSNVVTDVLEGVSFELLAEGTATLDVGRNIEESIAGVQEFVDGVNALLERLDSELKVTEATDRSRSLVGDTNVRRLQREVKDMLTATVSDTDGFEALTHLGLRFDSQGKFSIDEEDLTQALQDDMEGVGEFFVGETGLSSRLTEVLDRYTDKIDGLLVSRSKSLERRIDGYDTSIERLEARIARSTMQLERQYTALETTMTSINFQGSQLGALLSGMAG